jgi:predicted secreted protein
MASQAIPAIGTVFERKVSDSSSGGAAVWTAVGEVTSIPGPSLTRTTIDVTSFDSTGGYKEFIGALRDGGELALEMNFLDGSYTLFKADLESDDKQEYRIVLPNTIHTTFNFTGLVTALSTSLPLDDKVGMTVTLKISGPVTVSYPAP